jgi:hypothetical protein
LALENKVSLERCGGPLLQVWRAWIELSRVSTDREILDWMRPFVAYDPVEFHATAAKTSQHGKFGKNAMPALKRRVAFFLVITIGTLYLL